MVLVSTKDAKESHLEREIAPHLVSGSNELRRMLINVTLMEGSDGKYKSEMTPMGDEVAPMYKIPLKIK